MALERVAFKGREETTTTSMEKIRGAIKETRQRKGEIRTGND